MISISSKIAFFKIVNVDLCFFMSFIKAPVPKLSPFTPKLRQGQKNKSLQSFATLVKFLVAGVRLELTTFGLWARRAANCSTPRCINKCYYNTFICKCQYFFKFDTILYAFFYIICILEGKKIGLAYANPFNIIFIFKLLLISYFCQSILDFSFFKSFIF